MTNQKDIFHTDIMKIRIMDIEYDGITEDEIRRIYFEEIGKELDVAVDIYYSEEYIDEVDANGFNGTMIHLFDEELGINEVYTITRGTEPTQENDWRPIDWIYNQKGKLFECLFDNFVISFINLARAYGCNRLYI